MQRGAWKESIYSAKASTSLPHLQVSDRDGSPGGLVFPFSNSASAHLPGAVIRSTEASQATATPPIPHHSTLPDIDGTTVRHQSSVGRRLPARRRAQLMVPLAGARGYRGRSGPRSRSDHRAIAAATDSGHGRQPARQTQNAGARRGRGADRQLCAAAEHGDR